MPLRIVSGILGFLFFVQGIQWVAQPAVAAEGLGMTLLEGMGRSTQIGDFGGFFLSLGGMILLGAYGANAQWLRAAALLLGSAAAVRVVAWAAHGAPLAVEFIGIEVVVTAILLFIASRFDGPLVSD